MTNEQQRATEGAAQSDCKCPDSIYRWRALDNSGFCYGSNPPVDLPQSACLTAFYRQPDRFREALFEISGTGNLTATPAQFTNHLQKIARDALSGAPMLEQHDDVSTLRSQANAGAEWMTCESRRPWAANSLHARAVEMRQAEKRCRNAFRKDFMGEPARYVADAFGEAAAAFEARLAVIDAAQKESGND